MDSTQRSHFVVAGAGALTGAMDVRYQAVLALSRLEARDARDALTAARNNPLEHQAVRQLISRTLAGWGKDDPYEEICSFLGCTFNDKFI